MLAVTDAAAEAISALTAEEGQPDNAGLRFSVQEAADQGAALALAVTGGPESGDEVVTASAGAQVFLEPQAAQFLSDKVLDLQQTPQGELSFAVVDQTPPV